MKEPCWMQALHNHYRTLREKHPNDRLLVVFDIDGTLVDKRPMIHHLLTRYDREQGTGFFRDLSVEDITVHEHHLEEMLEERDLPGEHREEILTFYLERYWSRPILEKFHRPYPGGFELVRWFQERERTFVGLNTARPECFRSLTLRHLNREGDPRGVEFLSRLLFMQRPDVDRSSVENKVRGIRTFQERGYRVVAMLDNEPENLAALHEDGLSEEGVLLLHADTEFASPRRQLPDPSLSGRPFDPSPFLEGAFEGEEIRSKAAGSPAA